MTDLERIREILKHCAENQCYACPLRQSRDCVRSMAFEANRVLKCLTRQNEELTKRNAELEALVKEAQDASVEASK